MTAGLVLHVGSGIIAIVAGYGAVSAPKGERLHRLFGKVFVVSMLLVSLAGAALAAAIHQPNNIAGGILVAYLVATAWVTVQRGAGEIGRFEKFAALVPIGVAVLFLLWGTEALMSGGRLYGYAAPLYFAIVPVGALFALLDIKMIRQGGLRGAARITRHVWRMCFAFLFAAVNVFIGQQKVMPVWMHGSPVLLALGLAPLGFMLFWMVRVRFGNRFKSPENGV